jgi:hypothetical protein
MSAVGLGFRKSDRVLPLGTEEITSFENVLEISYWTIATFQPLFILQFCLMNLSPLLIHLEQTNRKTELS